MSTLINNAGMSGMNQLYTALTDAFSADGTRCFLLKRSGETVKFTVIAELLNGFFAEWDGFREQMRFTYATAVDVTDTFAAATHIGYGVPSDDGKVEVYVIPEPLRDIVSPGNGSWEWKAFADKVRNERFTIPTP